ncbi:hypothetical protein AT5A_26010 [Agrobacterium tumefaciens 5A]|nr:hypothetical protein AT5A_26010 [Agrobacterium tumefaciens 5A]
MDRTIAIRRLKKHGRAINGMGGTGLIYLDQQRGMKPALPAI